MEYAVTIFCLSGVIGFLVLGNLRLSETVSKLKVKLETLEAIRGLAYSETQRTAALRGLATNWNPQEPEQAPEVEPPFQGIQGYASL